MHSLPMALSRATGPKTSALENIYWETTGIRVRVTLSHALSTLQSMAPRFLVWLGLGLGYLLPVTVRRRREISTKTRWNSEILCPHSRISASSVLLTDHPLKSTSHKNHCHRRRRRHVPLLAPRHQITPKTWLAGRRRRSFAHSPNPIQFDGRSLSLVVVRAQVCDSWTNVEVEVPSSRPNVDVSGNAGCQTLVPL